jgi:hypothetical protein
MNKKHELSFGGFSEFSVEIFDLFRVSSITVFVYIMYV